MANRFYDKGRQAFAEGLIAWLTDNIKCVLVDSGAYTVDTTTHQYLSDIPGGARIATTANLGSKTSTSGVLDAADTVFSAVTGVQSEYVVAYKDTGLASSSPLILLIDSGTNLPVTPNGSDINVSWDNGANKIAKL